MADSALLPVFSYLGWTILPNLATQFLQSIYYRLVLPAGTAPPRPGTPQHARDYRRIRVTVLVLYLLYTLVQSLYDIKLAGDFYTLLSADPSTPDKEIRTRLRRLAARFHPDKQTDSTRHLNEKIFLDLRLAGDTLTTPSHRFAYERFGPGIITHLPKPDENVRNLGMETGKLVTIAVRQKLPSYLGTLGFVYVLNTFFLPGNRTGKFWRYAVVGAGFILEWYLVTHNVPALPGWAGFMLGLARKTKLGHVLPGHLLPFQILQVSNALTISLNIFISQVGALFPSKAPDVEDRAQLKAWMGQLNDHLGQLAAVGERVEQEASGLLQLKFAPYKGQTEPVKDLRRGMQEGMVLGQVKMHPDVQQAVSEVLLKRRSAGQTQSVRPDGADVVDLLNSDEQFT